MTDRERLDDLGRRIRAAEIKHHDKLNSYYIRKIKAHLAKTQETHFAMVFTIGSDGMTWRPA